MCSSKTPCSSDLHADDVMCAGDGRRSVSDGASEARQSPNSVIALLLQLKQAILGGQTLSSHVLAVPIVSRCWSNQIEKNRNDKSCATDDYCTPVRTADRAAGDSKQE